jgi:Na+-driven multidrug efflux pump
MSEMSSVLHTFGMIEGPLGPVIFGFGVWVASHPRFQPWLGVSMQYMGVGLTLAGAIGYFQPFGVELSQHAIGLIFMITLVFVAMRYRRTRNVAKGKPQP